MTILRIILFSLLASLALYVPFYHFAYVYHNIYVHVPEYTLNWWVSWAFNQEHAGIQLYIAYTLMYLAMGLTGVLEWTYLKLGLFRWRWIVAFIGAVGGFYYLKSIGFFPPMAEIFPQGPGAIFIAVSIMAALILGQIFDRRWGRVLLWLLLFGVCMVGAQWAVFNDAYFHLFAPAMRTLRGCAVSRSYFQYDQWLSLFPLLWLKLGLPPDRFHVVVDFSYLALFAGVYFLAKKLFFDKRFAFYFVFSLVLIKMYGTLVDQDQCPQVSPLRLDLWLALAALCYWRGPQSRAVGALMGVLLFLHHAFGMIYSVSYLCLILTLLAFKILQQPARTWAHIKETIRQYFPNACMMAAGFLLYQFFISSAQTIPSFNFEKYNIGFMPIASNSFFWYVPPLVSTVAVLLWEWRAQLPQRYFQTGMLLIFLAIGNLLYFFGRSHENNLLNVSANLWLIFFMLMDLVVYRMWPRHSAGVRKLLIPAAGVLIVALCAFYYSGRAVERIKEQAVNLPRIADLFKPPKGPQLDFDLLKKLTRNNPNVVFLSPMHDFEYYYYGGYTPAESCPLMGQFFMIDLMDNLNNSLLKGADIIVPAEDAAKLERNIVLIDAQYQYRFKDFLYLSNNKPAFDRDSIEGPGR